MKDSWTPICGDRRMTETEREMSLFIYLLLVCGTDWPHGLACTRQAIYHWPTSAVKNAYFLLWNGGSSLTLGNSTNVLIKDCGHQLAVKYITSVMPSKLNINACTSDWVIYWFGGLKTYLTYGSFHHPQQLDYIWWIGQRIMSMYTSSSQKPGIFRF